MGEDTRPRWWFRVLGRQNEALARLLATLGSYVGRRKGTVLLVCLLMCMATFSGFIHIQFASDEIWLPKGSTLKQDDDAYHSYGFSHRDLANLPPNEAYYTITRQDGGDVIGDPAAMHKAVDVWTQVGNEAQIRCSNYDLSLFGYYLAYHNTPGTFEDSSSMDCPTYDSQKASDIKDVATNNPNLLRDLIQYQDTQKDVAWSGIHSRQYNAMMIGGILCTGDSACGPSDAGQTAKALRIFLQNGGSHLKDSILGQSDSTHRVTYYYSEAQSEELDKSLAAAYIPTGVGYLIMMIWVCTSLGGANRVTGMPNVGLAAIGTVILSTAAGIGICAGFGVRMNPITPLLPLMLLGIGVDDAFVLVNAYRDSDSNLDPISRARATLQQGGLAVTMTSVTDIAAFAAGSFSTTEAVSSFCTVAATCIAFDFALQISLFVAILLYDRQRAAKGKLWLCCCVKSSKVAPNSDDSGEIKKQELYIEHFFRGKMAPVVLSLPGKVCIMIFFIGLTAFFAIKIDSIVIGQTASDVVPSGSFVLDTTSDTQKYFLDSYGSPLAVANGQLSGWATVGSSSVYNRLKNVLSVLETSSDTSDDWGAKRAYCWIDAYEYFHSVSCPATGNTAQEDIATCFPTFLTDQTEFGGDHENGPRTIRQGYFPALPTNAGLPPSDYNWAGDVEFTDGTYTTTTRSRCWSRFSEDFPETRVLANAEAMDRVSSLIDEQGGNLFFLWSRDMIDIERALYYKPSVKFNVLAALISCAIVVFFFLISPTVTIVVTFTVAMIDVWLFGFMGVADIHLNESSIIGLIMACGFIIDYIAHMGHAFMHQSGESMHERVAGAMAIAGRSIVMAGITTLIAAECMFFGGPIFATFAAMFNAIVVFGLAGALLFVPVVLSFCTWVQPIVTIEELPALTSWDLKFRYVSMVVLGIFALCCAIASYNLPWTTLSGVTTSGDNVYYWRSNWKYNKMSIEVKTCTTSGCDASASYDDLDLSSETVAQYSINSDLLDASEKMAGPIFGIGAVLGSFFAIGYGGVLLVGKHQLPRWTARSMLLFCFLVILGFGLYQNTLADYQWEKGTINGADFGLERLPGVHRQGGGRGRGDMECEIYNVIGMGLIPQVTDLSRTLDNAVYSFTDSVGSVILKSDYLTRATGYLIQLGTFTALLCVWVLMLLPMDDTPLPISETPSAKKGSLTSLRDTSM